MALVIDWLYILDSGYEKKYQGRVSEACYQYNLVQGLYLGEVSEFLSEFRLQPLGLEKMKL